MDYFYQRTIEQEINSSLSKGHKVILLLGPRQVGKTSLLNKIAEGSQWNWSILNGEEQMVKESFSSLSYRRMMESIGNKEVLFIDEAQNIPNIGKNIKILHDKNPNVKIILSGSSSLELANNLQEPLTGRKTVFNLLPLSIEELCNDGISLLQIREMLPTILKFGLYPEVVTQKTIEDKERILREVSASYLYRDIIQLTDIKYTHKINDLVKLLALQIGSTVSINKLSNALNISAQTVENYINLLEQSFVIFRLRGFSKNLSKEISKMDKIYFYDVGVRNMILNNFGDMDSRLDKGSLWENFLIAERVKSNLYHMKYNNLYFWRTYTGAEIDYIEEKNGRLHAFECKFSHKSKKAPTTWVETYPNSTFKTVNLDNFFEFILHDYNL